ncbi:hypothetical protein H8692_05610 [Mogibacterium sp. NSJ-24]|jgi:hypothetical protein|uniref:Uncharacterized protein n=1 Tax=Lentihominibacter hominis TaxID=2763645 RepID=A0A926E8C1_9FIRM|nr:hypothetical protein [Lentihominibacter hominis]MBC8568240.1 hypothetical protein [Lentihominibacter hominis]
MAKRIGLTFAEKRASRAGKAGSPAQVKPQPVKDKKEKKDEPRGVTK